MLLGNLYTQENKVVEQKLPWHDDGVEDEREEDERGNDTEEDKQR